MCGELVAAQISHEPSICSAGLLTQESAAVLVVGFEPTRAYAQWLARPPRIPGSPGQTAHQSLGALHRFLEAPPPALSATDRARTEYLWSSTLRELVEAHRPAFNLNRIQVPEPRDFVGEHYLTGFDSTVSLLRHWLEHSV